MRRPSLLVASLVVLAVGSGFTAGCASPGSLPSPRPTPFAVQDDTPTDVARDTEPKPTEKNDASSEREELEKLEDAMIEADARRETLHRKIDLAELQGRLEMSDAEHRIATTAERHAVAKAKLEAFEEKSRQRIEDAQLDVESARDRMKNETEELEQLEMMYAGSELEDRTSEIVLNRGRRALELAHRRLALQEAQLALLQGSTLPLERLELDHELRSAEHEARQATYKLQLAQREFELSIHQLRTEREIAERAYDRAGRKLNEAQKKAKSKAEPSEEKKK